MEITETLIHLVLKTAVEAGSAILQIYKGPINVEYKQDNSPLTVADKKAHEIISQGLADTGFPVLSEEGAEISFEIRKNWTNFWLVDPLDGTKEFIRKNGDFTVNIALITGQQPAFGVVYAPVHGALYWGSKNGSFRLRISEASGFAYENYNELLHHAELLPCISRSEGLIVLGSRSHMNIETELFIKNLEKSHSGLSFVSRGSSLKFCTLAEGGADIYPRFGPTMEWDTAAGHAVALFADCSVNQVANGLPLLYNKPSLLNPFFIAERKKK